MQLRIPKIYPITNETISGLSHLEQVKLFIEGGATFIQLRDKESSSRELFKAAKECVEFARKSGVKLIVNDRVDIALAVNADGVHLGQHDLPPEHARKVLGDEFIIGFSTHSVEQAKAAAELPVAYIAIGPIFGTDTKSDTEPVVGLEGLRQVRDAVRDRPLVAIGGITPENVGQVLTTGADSAAMISGLFSASETSGVILCRLLNAV